MLSLNKAPCSPSVITAALAPFSINFPAAISASFNDFTDIPVICSASISFGVTKSQSFKIFSFKGCAGAGFKIVIAPPSFAKESAVLAASSDCSSWVIKTRDLEINSLFARISSSFISAAAPGLTIIALFPVLSSIKMYAAPV